MFSKSADVEGNYLRVQKPVAARMRKWLVKGKDATKKVWRGEGGRCGKRKGRKDRMERMERME